MQQLANLIRTVLNNGVDKDDRTGTGIRSLFGPQISFDLENGFPMPWLKYTWFKGIVHERLWFLNAMPPPYQLYGNTNIKYLVDHDVHIWDEWAYRRFKRNDPAESITVASKEQFIERIKEDEEFAHRWGNLGPIYGEQFKRQLGHAIGMLKDNPDSRRHVINLWQYADLDDMELVPCHSVPVQFWTRPLKTDERVDWLVENKNPEDIGEMRETLDLDVFNEELDKEGVPRRAISSKMYQRSADALLGLFFNIPSDALFLHMVGQVTNMIPERFIHTFGDVHIYNNHFEGAREVLRRWDEEAHFDRPSLKLDSSVDKIEDFRYHHIDISNYNYHPKINLEVAV